MIQHRSTAWYNARMGKFTASCFHMLMSKPKEKNAVWSKTAWDCIRTAATEVWKQNYVVRPDNDATRWGLHYEGQAITEFAAFLGYSSTDIGTVFHPNLPDVGATPDTVIKVPGNSDLVLAQIKCPYSQKNHIKYKEKVVCKDSLQKSVSQYFWQVQGEMWVTNATYCYFVSFDPRLSGRDRLHYAKILRDEESIGLLEQTILHAIETRNMIVKELKENYDPETGMSRVLISRFAE